MMPSTNAILFVALGLVALLIFATSSDDDRPDPPVASLERLAEAGAEPEGPIAAGTDTEPPKEPTYQVHIHHPEGPPFVKLASVDSQDRVSQVACSTCHSIRKPNFENRDSTSLDEFHQGLKVDHHKIACYACHNPDDADSLKAADGTKVSYQDVMTLCSQCHGHQATSFAHGAHGGMNGFWDLSRGPQTKNNCIDCHDPHAPRYPKMIVSFKPRDRFLEGEDAHDDHE